MKQYIIYVFTILLSLLILTSCNDENLTAPGKYSTAEAPASGTLKALGQKLGIQIGTAFSQEDMANAERVAIMKSEFDNVAFGYHMKHGAVVQNDGSFNWMATDAMVAFAKQNGLGIYGHTLVWHQNQNATYLNSLIGGGSGDAYANYFPLGDFESGSLDGWVKANPGLGIDLTGEDAHGGNYSVKLQSDPQYNTAWRLQLKAPTIKLSPGHLVKIEFWARCVGGGGKVRISTGAGKQIIGSNTSEDRQYLPDLDVTDSWQKFTYETVSEEGLVVGESGELQIVFDLGHVGGKTYYLDDVVINDLSPRVSNGGFETGNLDGWVKANPGLGIDLTGEDARGGNYSVKLVSDPQYNTAWRLQLKAPVSYVIPGHLYKIEFWARCVGGGGKLRVSTGAGRQLVGENTNDDRQYLPDLDVPDAWTKFTYENVYEEGLLAAGDEVQLVFDMGHVGGKTYYLDDVYLYDITAGEGSGGIDMELDPEVIEEILNSAMASWINAIVDRYKGDVPAWDVVNEPMADGESGLRTSANSDSEGSDVFFWSNYLGRDYALKALQLAEAADPDALLFINDYNLESNPAKLDSLLKYVDELKVKGAKIDGIGTQMHIDDPKSYGPIREMFEKLAATGLLIKITELDVKATPAGGTELRPINAEFQAAMYEYIIKTYLEVVPKEQQYGITIWGIDDASSWRNTDEKLYFPLLWDDNFKRKLAYDAVYNALNSH